jgi:UDP-N-acetylmuramoyl-tripeptide--D-alanyl-D-alanine ligase
MRRLIVRTILYYFRFLAKLSLKRHKPIIIGIAGSVGKTTCRNALLAILIDHYSVKAIGNSETGVPLGILGIIPKEFSPLEWVKIIIKAPFGINHIKNTKYLIVEMGIDEPYPPKNMSYLLSILHPDIAISLNVSVFGATPSHAMQFEKLLRGKNVLDVHEYLLEAIANEDTKIIRESGCKIGIYNIDDLYIQKLLIPFEKSHLETKIFTFGKSRENDVSYLKHEVGLDGTIFQMNIKIDGKNHKVELRFSNMLLPKEYQEIFGASILAALQTDISLEEICNSLVDNFISPKGRASMFAGINNTVLIDSSYNASRASMVAFLDMAKQIKVQTKRDLVVLFGDMRELGSESEAEHKQVASHMKDIVDYLFLVGTQTKEYIYPYFEGKGMLKELKWFETSHDAGIYLKSNLPKNSLVLIKGSQNTIYLEEAIKYILLNKEDMQFLSRQGEYWNRVKNKQLYWQTPLSR